MFTVPAVSDLLTQGDLLDDCPLVSLRPDRITTDPRAIAVQRWLARIIVLTQACDLAQPKTDLVLVAPVRDAQKLVEQGVLKGTIVRDHVRRHLVFGWYFIPASPAPLALPEALIDLRDVHSVPRVVLEQLIRSGKRVASLVSPYREHLAQHFAVTYMRVALPEPYATQP
jgi:hypothetical protein